MELKWTFKALVLTSFSGRWSGWSKGLAQWPTTGMIIVVESVSRAVSKLVGLDAMWLFS